MVDERREFDDFCKLAIEGAKLLMKMAHNVETNIRYQQLIKNNIVVDALTFQKEGEQISPTLHMTNYFNRYKSGEDINTIIKDITDAAYRAMEHDITMPEMTPEEATRCIRLDLVNYENNKQMLEGVPFFTIGEDGPGQLAAFPRWYISNQASFIVNNEVCARMGCVPEEILQIAQRSTEAMEYRLNDIGSVLRETLTDMGRATEELDQVIDYDQSPQMLVLTTPDCCHGAAAMLSTRAMEEAKEILQSEQVFVIPSSIHECIIVPANGDIKADMLQEMVMSVNSTELDPIDILSDYPLKYDTKLTLAIEPPKMEQELDLSRSMTRRMEMSM